jgi:hypothetical protein
MPGKLCLSHCATLSGLGSSLVRGYSRMGSFAIVCWQANDLPFEGFEQVLMLKQAQDYHFVLH